jgi:hypothetical protein
MKQGLPASFRLRSAWLLPLGLLVLLQLSSSLLSAANEEIKPPFGFQWGESAERLEKMLVQAKARIVERQQTPDGLRLRVDGIAQRLLLTAYFSFANDSLKEIELHYGAPDWDTAQYTRFFDQTRRHIDQRYGAGKLIARNKSSVQGVTHTLMGYQWTQTGASLQMFLFTAEKGAEVVRTMSLHYRGD